MGFQRRGGRKRVLVPDGRAIVPTSRPQPEGTLIKALARAWRWQRMLDEGIYTAVSEIGDAENISKSYVSRILRLALLAPDIVHGILAGSTNQGLMLDQLERPLPASWEEQLRTLLGEAGASHHSPPLDVSLRSPPRFLVLPARGLVGVVTQPRS
jgi:hypothetical protein